jgi:hypothetical protein
MELLPRTLLVLCLSATWAVGASTQVVISHIPRSRVQSSALATIGYSKRLHILEVEFLNGAIYRYLNVPASVHQQLMAAASKARYYDQNIRRKYRSLRVRPRPHVRSTI